MTGPERLSDLDALRRWESAGGAWYLTSTAEDLVTVSLCRCDGGEEVERLVSGDQTLRDYVASRPSSEVDEPSEERR